MKRKDLETLGLEKEVIDKIMDFHQVDTETWKTEKTAIEDKHKAELEISTKKVDELTETVKKFDGVDVDKLKGEVSEWQTKYAQDIANERKTNAIKLAIIESGVKSEKAIKGFIDDSLIKLNDDGTLMGLKEQLEVVKNESPYLFADPDAKVDVNLGGTKTADKGVVTTTGNEWADAIAESMNK